MKRQQQPHKLQLNKKRRTESIFRDVSLSSSTSEAGLSSTSHRRPPFPPLPASNLGTVEQTSSNGVARPKEESSLLEILEMEEKKIRDMKWTCLPPPNLELYMKKPVVLLNWEDDMITNELSDDYPLPEGDTTTAYSIADDDSFAADISQVTARLEEVEKELYIIDSQDKGSISEGCEVQNQDAGDIRGNDHIPPAPDFNDDDDDDNDYGIGSDMDLFGDDDLDRLYDNVDQELQLRDRDEEDLSLIAVVDIGSQSSSEVTALGIAPSIVQPHPHPRLQESGNDLQSRNVDMKSSFQYHTSHQSGSKALHPREASSSCLQQSETTKVIYHQDKFTDGCTHDISQPITPQPPALQVRSSSLEYKFSPDSDDIDLPPVNWGRGSKLTASSSSKVAPHSSAIKDEQTRVHCSKDLLQTSSVAEKCLQLRDGDGEDLSLAAVVDIGSHFSSEVTALGIPPSVAQPHPHPQLQESGNDSRSRNTDVKSNFQEGSSSCLQQSETTKVIYHQDKFTNGCTRDTSQPVIPQPPAPLARSSSLEYKFSPDSEDIDLPPVNWGRGSKPTASSSSKVAPHSKDEQTRAHCSKDLLQASFVAEKCPICNFSFPLRYNQLEVDEHVAVCLSAVISEEEEGEEFNFLINETIS